MRVLICGIDGYIGWPLGLSLMAGEDFEIFGVDNFSRRSWVEDAGSVSAFPIAAMDERLPVAETVFGNAPTFFHGDLRDYDFIAEVLAEVDPHAIVHLGEMPSAPYSMKDAEHAYFTQENNVLGTLNLLFAMRDHCPEAHLVKLGTMGEYGTPNLDIPEGFFEVEFNGRSDFLPFPRQPGSFYHLSKVHDSHNVAFTCKVWGFSSTDIMQGVVYGTTTAEIERDERLRTRFDFDSVFGTAINRFCAQAVIGEPLTPYGRGGQTRGFICLRDSIQCLALTLRNPPGLGEYRVFNQFDEVYDVFSLAQAVSKTADELNLRPSISHIRNPRIEAEDHYYNPESLALRKLGFSPTHTLHEELKLMLTDLMPHRERILKMKDAIYPAIDWNPSRFRSKGT